MQAEAIKIVLLDWYNQKLLYFQWNHDYGIVENVQTDVLGSLLQHEHRYNTYLRGTKYSAKLHASRPSASVNDVAILIINNMEEVKETVLVNRCVGIKEREDLNISNGSIQPF